MVEGKVVKFDFSTPEGKKALWHSTSHILADAVMRLRPKAKLGIGPAIDEGFYYDFDTEPFTAEDLEKVEKLMKEIIKKEKPKFTRVHLSKKEAEKLYKTKQPYKYELLKEVTDKEISFTQHGKFKDLCNHPIIDYATRIGSVKILNTASAYWRGDSKNKILQRIYAISFPNKTLMVEYLERLEEVKKRDHRRIGKDLELFMFHEYSPGSPFFLPKGTVIYNELQNFLREEYNKRDYNEVITPQIFNKALWEKSGHWQHFKENMFSLKVDKEEYALKPMNCPSHLLMFKNKQWSYKDLPHRVADFCFLHRNELRGVLGGLTRVRKMSQDDAHIFCTPKQIKGEIKDLLKFIKYLYSDVFNLKFHAKLSTRPEKAMGEESLWKEAEDGLKEALDSEKVKYELKEGEGAFYGPKIDFDIKDALNRDWQLATIQLDFQMPMRFDATYTGEDNKQHPVVMIHRAILGTLERFIGILIEHYAGAFPLWLSPTQVRIINFTDRNTKHSEKIFQKLKDEGIRVDKDYSSETVQKKVRQAQLQKINYMVVIGDKEEKANTLAIRTRDGKVKFGVKLNDFIKQIKEEINTKK